MAETPATPAVQAPPVNHAEVVAKSGSDLLAAMNANVHASLTLKQAEQTFIAARTAHEKTQAAMSDATKRHHAALTAQHEAQNS